MTVRPDDTEIARLLHLAIGWIAAELRDQKIPSNEFIGTRTMLNEMIAARDALDPSWSDRDFFGA